MNHVISHFPSFSQRTRAGLAVAGVLLGGGFTGLAQAADCVSGVAYTTPGAAACTIPAGVTSLQFEVIGGGGGGEGLTSNPPDNNPPDNNPPASDGLAGAVVTGSTTVTPGDSINLLIGTGGDAGTQENSAGTGGGGGAASTLGSGTSSTNIAIAGGGGGGTGAGRVGAGSLTSIHGANGEDGRGGAAGTAPLNESDGFSGSPGTPSAGGGGGGGGASTPPTGEDGTSYGGGSGGPANNETGGGGGGGGGFGGGGGGAGGSSGKDLGSPGLGGTGGSFGIGNPSFGTSNNAGAVATSGGNGSILLTFSTPPASLTINLAVTSSDNLLAGITNSFDFDVQCNSGATYSGSIALANALTGTTTISGIAPDTCTITAAAPGTPPANYTWGTTPAAQTLSIAGNTTVGFVNTLNASTTPPHPIPAAVPVPVDAPWMLALMGTLMGLGAAGALALQRGRKPR